MTRLLDAGRWVANSVERLGAGRRSTRTLARVALLIGILAIGAAGLGGRTASVSSSDRVSGSASLFEDPTAASGDGSGQPVPVFDGTLDTGLGGILDLAGKGVLVLALLLLTLRLLNRLSSAGGSGAAHLVVLESRPLAQRASLHLVAIGERRLVVGLTPGGLVQLAELTADELPDPAIAAGEDRPASVTGLSASGPTIYRFARVVADLARRGGVVR